jgi:hypothetical protein
VTTTPCPDEQTIAAYVDGRLVDEELRALSAHLVECDRCYETVATTVRFLSAGGRTKNFAPPWALAPAMLTALAIAVVLTLCLWLLGYRP